MALKKREGKEDNRHHGRPWRPVRPEKPECIQRPDEDVEGVEDMEWPWFPEKHEKPECIQRPDEDGEGVEDMEWPWFPEKHERPECTQSPDDVTEEGTEHVECPWFPERPARPEKPEKPECTQTPENVTEEGSEIVETTENQLDVDSADIEETVKPSKEKANKSKKKILKATVGKNKKVTFAMNNVTYKDAEVTVTDSDGDEVKATIVKKTKNKLTLRIKSMKKDEKYTVTVDGVKAKGEKKYSSVSKTFTA